MLVVDPAAEGSDGIGEARRWRVEPLGLRMVEVGDILYDQGSISGVFRAQKSCFLTTFVWGVEQ